MGRSLCFFYIFLFLLSSCGEKIDRTEHRNYVLALASGKAKFKPLVKRMIEEYNTESGFRVLEYTDSMDSANCPVLITEGLEKKDGKVGWGQWFSETEHRGPVIPIPGTTANESVSYSLKVEFDEEFLLKNSPDLGASTLNLEIRKLFAHEIGHGFQQDHDPNPSDVMYFDISGNKNFAPYWERVRSYFHVEK